MAENWGDAFKDLVLKQEAENRQNAKAPSLSPEIASKLPSSPEVSVQVKKQKVASGASETGKKAQIVARAADDVDPFSRMNKTERRFFDHHMKEDVDSGKIAKWFFEAIKIRLGKNTTYTIDFVIIYDDGRVRLCEIKGGFIREDAAVKFKAAQELYAILGWWELWQWVNNSKGWKRVHPYHDKDAFQLTVEK